MNALRKSYRFFARLLNMNNLTNKCIEKQLERPMRLRSMLRSKSEKDNRAFAVTR